MVPAGSVRFCVSADVYPDGHPHRVYVPQRLGLSGDALPAEGLCHSFPPRAEHPEEEEEHQGLRVELY